MEIFKLRRTFVYLMVVVMALSAFTFVPAAGTTVETVIVQAANAQVAAAAVEQFGGEVTSQFDIINSVREFSGRTIPHKHFPELTLEILSHGLNLLIGLALTLIFYAGLALHLYRWLRKKPLMANTTAILLPVFSYLLLFELFNIGFRRARDRG